MPNNVAQKLAELVKKVREYEEGAKQDAKSVQSTTANSKTSTGQNTNRTRE